jgi:hypothetical protein
MYLDALSVGFVPEPALVLIVLDHHLLEALKLLQLSVLHLLLLNGDFLFDLFNKEVVQLVLLLLLHFLALPLILHLLVTHLLLKLDLAFIFVLLLSFALVVGLGLFDLKPVVFLFLLLL